VALERSLNRSALGGSHRQGELPCHLCGSGLEALDGMHNGLEIACDEHVDRPLTIQLGVPGVDPNLDSFRPVHMLELPDDVVNVDEAVSGVGGGS
jgi:hypothetical protein